MLVCSSPKLIAAYHVLHRLSEPRHPPYALNCFKNLKRLLYATVIVCYTLKCNLLVITTFYSQYVKELSPSQREKAEKMFRLRTYRPFVYILNLKELLVEDIGVEPMTLCVQGRCSSQLS